MGTLDCTVVKLSLHEDTYIYCTIIGVHKMDSEYEFL